MGKEFIVSVIIASALSSPLRSETQGMAMVSSDAYPAQILVAPSDNSNDLKVVWDAPDQLPLTPGDYSFKITVPLNQSQETCQKETTLEGGKNYTVGLTDVDNEGTCIITVTETK